jgi:NADH dehydrogenase
MPTRVLVLGGGFAGLAFCRQLRAPDIELTLVDRQNHHLFQPLLYQVAVAGLSAPDIAQPIRSILRDRDDIRVRLGAVARLELSARRVHLADQTSLDYDYLVVALGGATGYFGHPEWEHHAPGLKTLDDALLIRRRLLLAFEHAENEPDPDRVRELLTVVVVGGGPTGVELAGAIAELANKVLRSDFVRIDPARARVLLVEGGSRVLDSFSPALSEEARLHLEQLGVEVRLSSRVADIHARELAFADGSTLRAGVVLWAAGVAASPVTRDLAPLIDRAGRLRVQPDLSLPGHPEVFALGDIAAVSLPDGSPVPGVAPAAMQMGRHAARLVAEELRARRRPGEAARPAFLYRDKGKLATIGRAAGVAEIGRLHFSGWPAWAAWLLVHIVFLVGFRNRLSVLLSWTYSYFTYRVGARVVTGLDQEPRPGRPPATPPGKSAETPG